MSHNTFEIVKEQYKLKISFSSRMEFIERVNEETLSFLAQKGITDKSQIFSISLVMREGLTNAIKHGHHFDAQKIVRYTLTIDPEHITMQITDQGEGFNWRNASKMPPSPIADHGRGLPIMEEYFSEYSYNDKGNQLTLKKRLTP